jgi:hypothetical protein
MSVINIWLFVTKPVVPSVILGTLNSSDGFAEQSHTGHNFDYSRSLKSLDWLR